MYSNLLLQLHVWYIVILVVFSGETKKTLPFDRVFALGFLRDQLVLVTGTEDKFSPTSPQVYNLDPKCLFPGKGQLTLGEVKSTPLLSLRPNLVNVSRAIGYKMSFDHWWTMRDSDSNEQFLSYDVHVADINFQIVTSMNFTIGNDSFNCDYLLSIDNRNETWISSIEPMTIYAITRNEPRRIVKYACSYETYPNIANLRLFQHVSSQSPLYSMCSNLPNDGTMFMTTDRCPYPVKWNVTSGYVHNQQFYLFGDGKVYIFDKQLFDSESSNGHYIEKTFEDFFLTDLNQSTSAYAKTSGSALPLVGIICIVGLIILIVVVLVAIIWYKNYSAKMAETKPEGEQQGGIPKVENKDNDSAKMPSIRTNKDVSQSSRKGKILNQDMTKTKKSFQKGNNSMKPSKKSQGKSAKPNTVVSNSQKKDLSTAKTKKNRLSAKKNITLKKQNMSTKNKTTNSKKRSKGKINK